MTFILLEQLREFLLREVCAGFRLKRPVAEEAAAFELAEPAVHIGWPETQLAGEAVRQRVPGIIIGLSDDISDDGEERRIPVWLAVVVHSTGTIGEDGGLTADNTGYHDLLNLIDRTVRALRNAERIGEGMTLAEPAILYRPDNEQYYDYWVGYVEFKLTAPAGPRAAERHLL